MKRLNKEKGGVKRPLRVKDLDDIWAVVGNMFALGAEQPAILNGFRVVNTDEGEKIGSGYLAIFGRLWKHTLSDETSYGFDTNLFCVEMPSKDWRVLEDGSIMDFASDFVILDHVPSIAIMSRELGYFSKDNIAKWRIGEVADGSITTMKIADGSVVSSKIGDGQIQTAHIKNAAITTQKLGDRIVAAKNIADGAVTRAKLNSEFQAKKYEWVVLSFKGNTLVESDSLHGYILDEVYLTDASGTALLSIVFKNATLVDSGIVKGSISTEAHFNPAFSHGTSSTYFEDDVPELVTAIHFSNGSWSSNFRWSLKFLVDVDYL